jgi:Purine catabolism regulatory protein-like family/PucR C-terminal helix-turn-helix domain
VTVRDDLVVERAEALTVTDLVGREGLGLSVITGAARLRGVVRRAYVTDLPEPGRYLQPGDLVLTSGTWHGGPADCDRFVDSVAGSGAAGLVVGLLLLGTMPERLVEACARHGLPLLTIAREASFGPVTEAVLSHHLGAQDAALSHTAAFHRQLVEAVSRAEGIAGILALFGREYFQDCWALSTAGTVLASVGARPSDAEIDAVWQAALKTKPFQHDVAAVDGRPVTVSVITSSSDGGSARGVLACRGDYRDWPPDALEAWRTVADLYGAELESAHAALVAEHRRIGELAEVLGAESAAPGEVSALLRLLGADPRLPTLAVCAALAGGAGPLVLDSFLRTALGSAGGFVGSCVVDDEVIVFVNGPQARPDLVARLLESAAPQFPVLLRRFRVAVGVSEASTSVSQLSAVLAGARERLRAALGGRAALTVVADLDADSHTTLVAALPARLRRDYRERMLAPVLEYDRLRGSELLRTLASFLETCGSWQRSAEELYVHVNTLRYRIQRIEELTGKDLGTMRDRTDLYLALEFMDLDAADESARLTAADRRRRPDRG